jgi:hypothetical protein
MVASFRLTGRRGVAHDLLLDRTEDRAAVVIMHLDPHPIAELQPGRARRAVPDRLQHAPLREARRADRGALLARGVVGDRARADDRAGREMPGRSGVRDQPREVEGHVDSGIRPPERPAVDVALKRQVHPVIAPGAAELLRRHRDRREG